MATKNTFVRVYVVVVISVLMTYRAGLFASPAEESEFKLRREYFKSRYEDFFFHYDFVDHYEALKNHDADRLKAERLKDEQAKDQARREHLKIRKLPGPYNEIEDGTNKKEDQKAKDQARREFLDHRSSLERLEKSVQKVPPEIESGLENLER